ncbi:MAG: DUF3098 domain-containing protein [Chitinophagales bacterium]|nr:DUF3098 domain-containing protein [Chitinophagales bacterium]
MAKVSNTTANVKKTATTNPKSSNKNWASSLLENDNKEILYDKTNYIIMGVGVAFIILGFVLMAGGGSADPNVFNEKEIYSTQRITVAPILVILGFIIEIVAILKKPAAK